MLRTGNKGLAAATLLLDGLKGTVAVSIGWRFGRDGALAAALGAYLGHCFPVWLGFKGGKGVATFLGVLLGAALADHGGRGSGLARHGRREALFVALGARRQRRRAARAHRSSAATKWPRSRCC